jgi:cytosine/adenosine deaminase-related metal-dependent hydrolase
MQLTDVICYIIRKGKEGEKELDNNYRKYQEALKTSLLFPEWVDAHGHKGQRYFYQSYRRLNTNKPWTFSKDFPR